MRQLVPLLALALALPSAHAGVLRPPATSPRASDQPLAPVLLARERGGRGGGSRMSSRGGGGGRGATGLGRRNMGLDRGNRRPEGGWSRKLGDGDRGRRDFDRARGQLNNRMGNIDRDRIRRSVDRDDWNRARDRWQDGIQNIDKDRVRRSFDRVDKNWDRVRDNVRDEWRNNVRDEWRDNVRDWDRRVERGVDRLRRWDDDWPGWARPGWQLARPWRYGWYGNWTNPPWGWWTTRSVAWGVGSLATSAMITNAVNQAIAASQPTIVVQDAGYTLYYNSIEPTSDQMIRFTAATGDTRFEATGDCQRGELNGREPAIAAQAQLLNAACQVAFGS
ncbi:MAG: hypothetical protein ACKO45_10070 [Cyanobium sp.]